MQITFKIAAFKKYSFTYDSLSFKVCSSMNNKTYSTLAITLFDCKWRYYQHVLCKGTHLKCSWQNVFFSKCKKT